MIRQPPRSTRTDTPFPYTTLFRSADATSMLYLYQALTALRRREPALSIGSWSPVITEKDLFAYRRKHDGRAFLIALNLGAEPLAAVLPADLQGELLISTHLDRDGEAIGQEIDLRSEERRLGKERGRKCRSRLSR